MGRVRIGTPTQEKRIGAVHRGLTGARTLVGTRYLSDPALRAEYEAEIAPRTRAALVAAIALALAGAVAVITFSKKGMIQRKPGWSACSR